MLKVSRRLLALKLAIIMIFSILPLDFTSAVMASPNPANGAFNVESRDTVCDDCEGCPNGDDCDDCDDCDECIDCAGCLVETPEPPAPSVPLSAGIYWVNRIGGSQHNSVGQQYTFTVAWDSMEEPTVLAPGGVPWHEASGSTYTMSIELLSGPDGPGDAINIPLNAQHIANRSVNVSMPLNDASLYRIVITRSFFAVTAAATQVFHDEAQEIFFLTNIMVNASGVDGYTDRMQINWRLPTVPGANPNLLIPNFRLRTDIMAAPETIMPWNTNEILIDVTTYQDNENLDINWNTGDVTFTWITPPPEMGGFWEGHMYGFYLEPILSSSITAVPDIESLRHINQDILMPQSMMNAMGLVHPNPTDNIVTVNRNRIIFSRHGELYTHFGAYISPVLHVNVHDLHRLALEWSPVAGEHRTAVRTAITGLEILQSLAPGEVPSQSIVSLTQTMAQDTDRWLHDVPGISTNFQFHVNFGEFSFQYDFPISPGTEPGIGTRFVDFPASTMSSRIAIFNPWLTEFIPTMPHIVNITDNRADPEPLSMSIDWEAFLRTPITAAEQSQAIITGINAGLYLDTNLTYRIIVTDDRNNFNLIPNDMATLTVNGNNLPEGVNLDVANAIFQAVGIENFIGTTNGVDFEQIPLRENTIYYVRIQAIRNEVGEQGQIFESEPAYGAHFIIPINNIPTDPNMLSRPPLRIQIIDGVPNVTEDTITIEWEEQWFEVYDPVESIWHSAVAASDGQIVFGGNINTQNNILMNLRIYNMNGTLNINATRNAILDALRPFSEFGGMPVVRMIDLTGVSYQVHTAEFQLVEAMGFETYLNMINGNTQDALDSWVIINPVDAGTGPATIEHTVSTSQNPEGNLQPDTAYIVFLRPFEGSTEGDRIAFFPNFVSATTILPRPPLEVTPIVPIIQPVEHGDTYLVVRWEHISGLYYELRFSENINDFSEGGILVDSETIREGGVIVHIDGRDYIEFRITGLFPQSPHFIWVRSIAVSNGIQLVSAWSNHIEMITLSLRAPQPPRGLGLASRGSLDIFNRENNTDHTPISHYHMIIEWMRDPNDDAEVPSASGADTDLMQPLFSQSIENSYMLRLNDLRANRRHYIRARTVVVVSRGSGNEIERQFIYIIELSETSNFADVARIEIPITVPSGNVSDVIHMESDWVEISIVTQMTDEEYDGSMDPDMVPLPVSNFEVIYNSSTGTLTHRFRSNQVDADGNRDNNVDQRFISQLVSSGTFSYQVDVSRHNNRLVQNRVVEVPFVIIEAFVERQVDLEILADNLNVTIPYGSIITNEVRALPGLTRTTRVVITISQESDSSPQIVSTPHRLSIQFIEGTNSVNVSEFERPLMLSMSASSSVNAVSSNIAGYISNTNTGGWQRLNSTYNPNTNLVSFAVSQAGSYTVRALNPAITAGGSSGSTLAYLHRVNSNLHIEDMPVFNENATIHANQFNQIIAAVARRQSTVQMNIPLSNDYFVTLGRSGMLVSGETVSREAGLSSLVRLYEVRSGYPISFFPSIEQTHLTDIISADESFHTGLLKAGHIGFIREDFADPTGHLTMGDLMFVLDMILST